MVYGEDNSHPILELQHKKVLSQNTSFLQQVMQSEGAEGLQLLVDGASLLRASKGSYRKLSFLKIA